MGGLNNCKIALSMLTFNQNMALVSQTVVCHVQQAHKNLLTLKQRNDKVTILTHMQQDDIFSLYFSGWPDDAEQGVNMIFSPRREPECLIMFRSQTFDSVIIRVTWISMSGNSNALSRLSVRLDLCKLRAAGTQASHLHTLAPTPPELTVTGAHLKAPVVSWHCRKNQLSTSSNKEKNPLRSQSWILAEARFVTVVSSINYFKYNLSMIPKRGQCTCAFFFFFSEIKQWVLG